VEDAVAQRCGGVEQNTDEDVAALDQALAKLAAIDKRKAREVELKFFGGLTGEEIAELERGCVFRPTAP
jgi:DNA-directed RNA polymerase specialized sigma24 family protein